MKPTTIIAFEAQNVLRIEAVQIDPSGQPVVVVGGKNGAGKTSVLRTIQMVIGGAKEVPPVPVRVGADEGHGELKLSNGLVVRRVFSGPDDKKGKLVVTDESGATVSSPQTLLSKMNGSLGFDPLAYLRKKPDEQAAILRELAGIDTSILDRRRTTAYDERTAVNRELKRLQAQLEATPRHPDAPAEEVSMAALASELELAQAHNDDLRQARRRHDVHAPSPKWQLRACDC